MVARLMGSEVRNINHGNSFPLLYDNSYYNKNNTFLSMNVKNMYKYGFLPDFRQYS